MPETEGSDPACGVGPFKDCLLQAFHPSGRGELGVYGSSVEHRALDIGRIHRGQDHWAQVVLRCAGDRMGARLVQSDHWKCDGEEMGDVVVQ